MTATIALDQNGVAHRSDNEDKDGGKASAAVDSDRGPDEDTAADDPILTTYHRLLSRHVDLVGDYAGDERFFIEGDSMLLRCFDDEQLDFHSGCQMLHAVYNVEHFLHSLVQRKSRFDIVFFESNRRLCIPPESDPAHASKYLLARAAIIQHLHVNLAKSHAEIHLFEFPNWDSPAFVNQLQSTSPYFLMAHDGALAMDRKPKQMLKDQPAAQKLAFREMILSFIARGYNVALINGLEWRDTKVMTMVIETRRHIGLPARDIDPTASVTPRKAYDLSSQLEKIYAAYGTLSDCGALAILTAAHLLSESPDNAVAEERMMLVASFLVHTILLQRLPLSSRRIDLSSGQADLVSVPTQSFLQDLCTVAGDMISSPSWTTCHRHSDTCGLMDFLDGRLFCWIFNEKPQLDESVQQEFQRLAEIVRTLSDKDVSLKIPWTTVSNEHTGTRANVPADLTHDAATVLPFANDVFDKHLASIHIDVDAESSREKSAASRKIFQEVTHWHNAKRPLARKGPPTPQDEKMALRAAKRNQLFMAEMRTYAASLTNAVGKSLEPETIIVGVARRQIMSGAQSTIDSDPSDSGSSVPEKGKPVKKKPGGGGKNAAKNAGKQAMLNNLAAAKAKKDESANDKIFASWQDKCKDFEADGDCRSRYRKAKAFRTNLKSSSHEVIGAESELYLLNCLLHFWIDVCRRKEQQKRIQAAALLWSHVRSIASESQLPKPIIDCLDLTIKTLGLPPVPLPPASASTRKLAFTFALPTKVESLTVSLPSKPFQLVECGPYLERSFDSRPDPRVDFQPDGWQRKVLDTIDADESVFVVAPTSAGKTFISFYAMRKVLEADDDSVLVYVAPTKALVNQIAAEIQARYSKNFKYGGKSVWGIHTRDYRINNPTGCQVLVTVPHILQIMLLAPSNANAWSSRVKRIIFDEIHSIGQAEDGVVWEQLLLMAPCPIIALSATVGNPDEFAGWLATTQEAIGKSVVNVHHPYRYSDLRKYTYVPPQRFAFHGIPDTSAFGTLGLEGLSGFNYVHPVAALVDKSRGIPEDLSLESRDCFLLWQAMSKVQDAKHVVPKDLDPEKALPDISRKVDVLKWEKALKQLLQKWLEDASSPYDKVIAELSGSFHSTQRAGMYSTHEDGESGANTPIAANIESEDDIKQTSLPMLCRLNEQDALPAILFNYDRHLCEEICQAVSGSLQEAEMTQRKTGSKWEKTLARWEEWKELKAKTSARAKAQAKKPVKKTKGDDDDGDKFSKLDLQRDAASGDDTKWESFDPEAPMSGYHFADYSKVLLSELDIYIKQLRWRDVPEYLLEALKRGVGVHHAGMNRKYRQIVEILFRKGFLRVIVATGTLALGINMPCKTVVFSGDSIFLTALNYRQCAGRAGRRGFDLLGNVVFQGVSRQKVCRLISSRLPDLNGHFPITTTLVLRLFTLLNGSNNAKYARSAINSLLSQPRLYMGGPSFKDQTMHHLRFSIEYLRRQQLLGSDGAPLHFAGLVSHLYFTENSSFAFHALLKEGYFHELCAGLAKNEKTTLETLMLVLAHCFNRVFCKQADLEYREKVVKPSSSIVFLPPMPQNASNILREHNQQTLRIYTAYVQTFVEQHLSEVDDTLPLSGLKAGSNRDDLVKGVDSLPPTRLRSPFVALSGPGDEFASIHDLCTTVRDGVFLEEAVVPHVTISPDEMAIPLNAWLLDFYKHGDVLTIERANGIRRADIWFLLNDFSLVLKTIIASLMNFMKLSEGGDMDMLDVMGNLDAHEEAEDDRAAATESSSEASAPVSVADSGIVLPERSAKVISSKKARNADSWEDLADEEDKKARELHNESIDAEMEAEALSSWDKDSEEGLKNVLRAFRKLHDEFNIKFRAMWA